MSCQVAKPSEQLPVELPGSDGREAINFRRIPAGRFRMGARGVFHSEEPIHRVIIEDDFYLAEFPTTQAQFAVWTNSQAYQDWFAENQAIIAETSPHKVAEPHRNYFASDSLREENPADSVTWWEARAYAQWLNRSGVLPPGWRADLPGETHWEYACRAGTESAYWTGEREQDLAEVGWYADNADGETQPVGQHRANPWGLYDMHGNVLEWCLDYYDARGYRKRLDDWVGCVLDEAREVEPEGAQPSLVAWAEMMQRYSSAEEEARKVRPADREWLEALHRMVDGLPKTNSWKQAGVHVAAKQALKADFGHWPDANLAAQLQPIFQGWVDMAESSDQPARVLRGGAYVSTAAGCRAAYRDGDAPGNRDRHGGFRLALVPGPVSAIKPASAAEPSAGGKARRDDAAVPQAEGGAADQAARDMNEIRQMKGAQAMKLSKANHDGPEKAISSVDGKRWWGEEVPFPFPPDGAPDPSVKRLVLGSLEDGKQLTLDDEVLSGLAKLRDHFPGLTHLHLWGLTNLEAVDGLPDQLECLDIRKCPALQTIGPLPQTARLKTIDLGDCPLIGSLPSGRMNELEYVWLDGCRGLEQFASLRPGLNSIKHLELHGCRFDDLDAAYCGLAKENVIEKVRSLYEASVTQGTEALAECKVIVLGNGGVGKTELVRALKGLRFHPQQDATDGIRLWKWDGDGYAPFPDEGVDRVDLNIWDFGGQDLYHNTHRLFLESRAVFIVVEREKPQGKPFRPEHPEDSVRPLNYWLDQVDAANPDKRVIVVRTGIDITDGVEPLEPWQDRVREEYRGLDYYEVSSRDDRRDTDSWKELRARLLVLVSDELGGAPAVQMPKGRAAVRRQLAKWQPSWDEADEAVDSARPMLRRHEFVDLARDTFRDVGLDDPDDEEIRWQLDYFHYCGAVYAPPKWMVEDSSPAAYPVIVDQRWVIEGIYELIVIGRDAREVIVRAGGYVTTDVLEYAWGQVCNSAGDARYDQQAQWVMQKYMKSCGLLVEVGHEMVMPEFLPTLEWLKLRSTNDRLVAVFVANTPARTYLIKDRALGQGFGCLLVGVMASHFGKVPLFRYGAVAEVKVGNTYTGGEQDVPVLVQWFQEDEDVFQGDICITIFGPAERDREVLEFLDGLIRAMPGFPQDAQFEAFDETPATSMPRPFKLEATSMPVRTPARAKLRLGIVGLSIAGEDEENPGIEFWPRVIERGLNAIPERNFEVLFYKRDEQRNTLPELVQDLIQSDLMIAFIGSKYLHSKYCMVEFLKAARWWSGQVGGQQPRHESDDGWLGEPKYWLPRLWPITLPDAEDLLARADATSSHAEHPSEAWKSQWNDRGRKYEGEVNQIHKWKGTARKLAPLKHVYDEWMRFACEGPEGLEAILAAISTNRRDDLSTGDIPSNLDEQELEAWADQHAKPLVERIATAMKEFVGEHSSEEKQRRFAEAASREWARGRSDLAADLFDRVLELYPDPAHAHQDALAGKLPEGCESLEPIRVHWSTRRGS